MMEFLAGVMPGARVMVNVHPLLVHFPIALLYAFLAAETLAWLSRRESLHCAASWMLYCGTLGALVSVATGLLAADTVEHDEAVHALMESHQRYGIGVLGLALVWSLWRGWRRGPFTGWKQAIHWGGALMLAVGVSLGADLGGLMVYGHAVAVKGRSSLPPEPCVENTVLPQPLTATPGAGSEPDAPAQVDPPPIGSHPHGHDGHTHTHKHTH